MTYAALILFGKRSALRKFLAQAEVIFEYRSSGVLQGLLNKELNIRKDSSLLTMSFGKRLTYETISSIFRMDYSFGISPHLMKKLFEKRF